MANFFDQFDDKPSSGQNFFDQFDKADEQKPTGAWGDAMQAFDDAPASWSGIEDDQPGFLGNMFLAYKQGGARVAKGAGGVYGAVTGDYDNAAARYGAQRFEDFAAEKSDSFKAQEADLQAEVDSVDGEIAKFGATVWGTLKRPELLADMVVQALPEIGAAVVTGGASALLRAGRLASMVASTGVASGLAGGNSGVETYNDLMKLDDRIWEMNEDYLQLAGSIGADEAKKQIASDKAQQVSAIVGSITAGTMGIAGKYTPEAILAGYGKGASTLGAAAGEGVQETAQGAAEVLANNEAVGDIDPNRALTQGLGQSTGMGLLAGSTMGGTTAGLTNLGESVADRFAETNRYNINRSASRQVGKAFESVFDDDAREAAAAAGGDALDQAKAASVGTGAVERMKARLADQAGAAPVMPRTYSFDADAPLEPVVPTADAPIVPPSPLEASEQLREQIGLDPAVPPTTVQNPSSLEGGYASLANTVPAEMNPLMPSPESVNQAEAEAEAEPEAEEATPEYGTGNANVDVSFGGPNALDLRAPEIKPEIIRRKSGKPFETERSAQAFIRSQKIDGARVIPDPENEGQFAIEQEVAVDTIAQPTNPEFARRNSTESLAFNQDQLGESNLGATPDAPDTDAFGGEGSASVAVGAGRTRQPAVEAPKMDLAQNTGYSVQTDAPTAFMPDVVDSDSLPDAGPALARYDLRLTEEGITEASVDGVAKLLNVAKKKKGEKKADRVPRIRKTIAALQKIHRNRKAIASGQYTVKELQGMAQDAGFKLPSYESKQGKQAALLKRLTDIQDNFQFQADTAQTKRDLQIAVGQQQAVPIEKFESLKRSKSESKGSWLYTPGDYDVATALGHTELLPPGQRPNEVAYQAAEEFASDPQAYMDQSGKMTGPKWFAFIDEAARQQNPDPAMRGDMMKDAYESLGLDVPFSQANAMDLLEIAEKDPRYGRMQEAIREQQKTFNESLSDEDVAWRYVGAQHRNLARKIETRNLKGGGREYRVTFKPEVDNNGLGLQTYWGSASRVREALREVAKLNPEIPSAGYLPFDPMDPSVKIELPPERRLAASGKPFKTKKSALASKANNNLRDYDVVPYQDGFMLERLDGSVFTQNEQAEAEVVSTEEELYPAVEAEKARLEAKNIPGDLTARDARTYIDIAANALYEGGGVEVVPDSDWQRGEAFTESQRPNVRTKSLNPDWFQNNRGEMGSVKAVKKAVAKALSGERLGARERRIVEILIDMNSDGIDPYSGRPSEMDAFHVQLVAESLGLDPSTDLVGGIEHNPEAVALAPLQALGEDFNESERNTQRAESESRESDQRELSRASDDVSEPQSTRQEGGREQTLEVGFDGRSETDDGISESAGSTDRAEQIEDDEDSFNLDDFGPSPDELLYTGNGLFAPVSKADQHNYTKNKTYISDAEAETLVQSWIDNGIAQGQDPETRAENANKVVLSLFDISGEWSQPWVDAGYDVYRFDIQHDLWVRPDMWEDKFWKPIISQIDPAILEESRNMTDAERADLQANDIKKFSVEFFADYFGDFDGKHVHAILMACPCTDFAVSGARHWARKDADGTTAESIELVQQALATVEYFKPSVWALENPVSRINKLIPELGEPRAMFQPHNFGSDYTKRTHLWGRFNGDMPTANREPTEGSKMHAKFGGRSARTMNNRSVTPAGFAAAFFQANNQIDNPVMSLQYEFDRLDPKLVEGALDAGLSPNGLEQLAYGTSLFTKDGKPADGLGQEYSVELENDGDYWSGNLNGIEDALREVIETQPFEKTAKSDSLAEAELDQINELDSAESMLAAHRNDLERIANESETPLKDQRLAGEAMKPQMDAFYGRPLTEQELAESLASVDGVLPILPAEPMSQRDTIKARLDYRSTTAAGSLIPLYLGKRKVIESSVDRMPIKAEKTASGRSSRVKKSETRKLTKAELRKVKSEADKLKAEVDEALEAHYGVKLNAQQTREAMRYASSYMDLPALEKLNQTAKVVGGEPAAATERLDDFGEKLGGARKDEAAGVMGLDIDSLSDSELKEKSLTQIWPKKMIDAIADVSLAALHTAWRNEIPAKPRSEWKREKWVKAIRLAQDALGGLTEFDGDFDALTDGDGRYWRVVAKAKVYAAIHRSQWGRIKVGHVMKGDNGYSMGLTIDGNRTTLISDSHEGVTARLIDRLEGPEAKAKPRMKFEIRTVVSGPNIGAVYINKTGDKAQTPLKTFRSVTDARAFLKDQYDDVVTLWEGVKARRNVSKADTRSKHERPRIGPDYRQGRPVTSELFTETFGFRGVEFGNWVAKTGRQQMLDDAFDAFLDLADALGVPPKALSLEGKLGIGFGSRGKGGRASAHYEPDRVVINLTKTKGAGSLAHEWLHAVDHYFGKQRGSTKYITEKDFNSGVESKVRPELAAKWENLSKVLAGSEVAKRSRKIDKNAAKKYWGTPIELAARTFEVYVMQVLDDKGQLNDFLANVTGEADYIRDIDTYPYPMDDEIAPIAGAFDALFGTMESRENDDGTVSLFSLGGVVEGIGQEKLGAVVDRVMSGHGSSADGVTVVATAADLPADILDQAAEQGVDPARIRGVQYQSSIYLVGDNIASEAQAEEILFHEATHAGFKSMSIMHRDKQVQKAAKRLFAAVGGYGGVQKMAERFGIDVDMDQYFDIAKTMEEGAAKTMLMHELVAHIGQKGNRTLRLKAQTLLGAIRQWLKQHNLFGLQGITDSEIAYLAHKARTRYFREGIWRGQEAPAMFSLLSDGPKPAMREGETQEAVDARPASWKIPLESKIDLAVRKLMDKYRPLQKVQQAIVEHTGQELLLAEDAYLAEELFHGRVGEQMRQIEDDMVKPISEMIAESDVERQDVDDYLMAMHAKDRNRVIRERDETNDAGAGMTDAQADEVLAILEADGKTEKLEEIAQLVYQMISLSNQRRLEAGLVTEQQLAENRAAFGDRYVPLRGFVEGEAETPAQRDRRLKVAGRGVSSRGRGYDVRGKEYKFAKGRGQGNTADSPLSYVVADLTEATLRAEKNRVAQTFLQLVESYPNPDAFEVYDSDHPMIERQRQANKVIRKPKNLASDSELFAVKVDGVQKYIDIKDPVLRNAMHNLGPVQLDSITRKLRKFRRYLSSIMTSWNPEFMAVNMVRDFETAMIALSSESTRRDGMMSGKGVLASNGTEIPFDPAGMKTDVLKDYRKSMKTIWQMDRNPDLLAADADHEPGSLAASYVEFLSEGAKTGYFDSKSIDEIKELVDRAIEGENVLQKAASAVIGVVEDANTAAENAVRLATFHNARKRGMSVKEAASLAKNLTVNFNRSGEWGVALDIAYLFYNAATQGTKQFLRVMSPFTLNAEGEAVLRRNSDGNPEVNMAQKIALGMLGSSTVFAAAMRELGGADEDGEDYWDKIPHHERDRNIIIWNFASDDPMDYVKIPLPYGFSIPWALGDAIEGAIRGSVARRKAIPGDLMASFMTAFSPIGMHAGGPELSAVPIIALPAAEVLANKNFFGSEIYPSRSGYDVAQKSDAYNVYHSTHPIFKSLAQGANDLTGGDKYTSGMLDIHPDVIEHYFEFLTGGAGRFATKTGGVIENLGQGTEIEPRELPIASRFTGNLLPFRDQENYFKRREEVESAAKMVEELKGRERAEYIRDNNGLHRLAVEYKATDKELRRLRKQRNEIRDNGVLSAREKERRLKPIEARIERAIDRFNKKYDQRVSRNGARGGT